MNRGYLAGILIFLCGSLHRPELFPVHKPGVVLTVVTVFSVFSAPGALKIEK